MSLLDGFFTGIKLTGTNDIVKLECQCLMR